MVATKEGSPVADLPLGVLVDKVLVTEGDDTALSDIAGELLTSPVV